MKNVFLGSYRIFPVCCWWNAHILFFFFFITADSVMNKNVAAAATAYYLRQWLLKNSWNIVKCNGNLCSAVNCAAGAMTIG